jgi:hypothetical protein
MGALVRTVIAVVITVLAWRVGNLPVFRAQHSYTCGIQVRYAGSSAHAALCIRAVLLTESLFGLLVCTSFSTKLHTDTPSIETGLVTSVAALCLIVFVSDQTYGMVECNTHLASVGHHARQRSMGCCPLGLRQV